MCAKFIPGDLVKFKSTNQMMSIKSIAQQQASKDPFPFEKYECVWYDGNQYQKALFTEDVLELVHHLRKEA